MYPAMASMAMSRAGGAGAGGFNWQGMLQGMSGGGGGLGGGMGMGWGKGGVGYGAQRHSGLWKPTDAQGNPRGFAKTTTRPPLREGLGQAPEVSYQRQPYQPPQAPPMGDWNPIITRALQQYQMRGRGGLVNPDMMGY